MPGDLDALVRFLPRLVNDQLRTLSAVPTAAREEVFGAGVMLADISGFTALAERLARQGPSGAEALTRTLNALFDPLIERIHASGGDVLKFAGDALLVVWPQGEGGLSVATHRAAASGMELQQYAEREQRGEERLRLKVSIGAGSIRLHHIGGWDGRWELLVTGEGLSSLAEVTPVGRPGQVLLTEEARRHLGPLAQVTALDVPGSLLESLAPPPVWEAPASRPQPLLELVVGHVPEAVSSRHSLLGDAWLSDLRQVSVLFINFPNATYRTPLERAQAIMFAVQQQLDRFEGTVNKISVDEKGVSIVAVFGTPPHAHADDPARAVLCARAIQADLRGFAAVHAIGLASGPAFCGVVGASSRCEYTVLGDTVNLAARLMQAAKDDLLCDATTATRASARAHFVALPALTVKGKADPVPVFRPEGELEDSAQAGSPLLGRAAELAVLRTALSSAREGSHAGAVLIEGEAGLGKSRLLAEVEHLCREIGLPHYTGAADPLEREAPYFGWRPILEQILRIEGAPEERNARAQAHLAELGLTALGPLLNPLLSLDLPETPETAELSGHLRGENTRELLIRLLAARSEVGPVVVSIEDVHWLDHASWSLAVAARDRAPALLLVLTRRPPEPPEPIERRVLLADGTRLILGPLASEEAVTLACQRLGVAGLPEPAARLVRDRAGGHPYYSEELAYALRDSGLLRIEKGVASLDPARSLDTLHLPPSIQGVIAQRVDRLAPDLQLTLKTASVIGRTFGVKLLREIHPSSPSQTVLERHLDELARLDLTHLDSHDRDRSYAFKHALTREAVYGGVLVSTRRALHAAAAQWYEREHAGALAPLGALLAYHWTQAADFERARRFLELAGEQALQSGAPREAASFLAEAIALERAGVDPALDRARRRRLWGEALLNCGRLGEERSALGQAVLLAESPLPGPRSRWAPAFVGHAVRQLQHRHLPSRNRCSEPEKVRAGEAARAHQALAEVCFFLNQPEGTLFCTLAAVNLAEDAGGHLDLARTYASFSLGSSLLPMPSLSAVYERLTEAQLGEKPRLETEAWARMALGMVQTGQGRWGEARTNLERSREIFVRLGDSRRRNEAAMILSVSLWLGGELEAARVLVDQIVESARRSADVHMQSGSSAHLSYCLLRSGQLREARARSEEAISHAEASGAMPELVYAQGLLALSQVRDGRLGEARTTIGSGLATIRGVLPTAVYAIEGYSGLAEAALELRRRDRSAAPLAKQALARFRSYARTFPIAIPRLRRLEGQAAVLDGRASAASRAFAESLAEAEEMAMPLEAAWAHRELALTGPIEQREGHLQAAREVFARLGTPVERDQAMAIELPPRA